MGNMVPDRMDGLTTDYLSELVGEAWPGAALEDATITRVRAYGDADNALSVSTSNQISIDVRYKPGAPAGLPRKLLAKMSFTSDMATSNPDLDPLFENEVLFYNRVRGDVAIESPRGMGGRFDAESRRFILLMEDIGEKRPHINSMMDADDLDRVRAGIETYARLHARFWESPRFGDDLAWVQGQTAGSIEDMFDHSIKDHVIAELARERFKDEMAQEYGLSEQDMYLGEKALKRHFATRPQTILHGDAHFANTYTLPDGTAGIIDWQVFGRGFGLFDVAYYVQTALSVEGRRAHERDLVDQYRDRLRAHGVAEVPDRESLWLDYRRAMHHGFYLGWLTAPRENYGWEVMVLGNHRTKAACIDHESARLVRALL